jgi:opacity protein-like surface antigen
MKTLVRLIVPCALVFFALPVHAQRFGAQINWGEDWDLGIGARIEFPLGLQADGILSRAFAIGSFDYYFPDCGGIDEVDCSFFEINLNGAVPLTAEGFNPYVGGGLNIARFSVDIAGDTAGGGSDTEVGLNLLGGLRFLIGTIAAFAEAKFVVNGAEQLAVTFGVLFGGS